MKKFLFALVAVMAVVLLGVTPNLAGGKKVTCKCPVSGKDATEKSAVDYKGAKVYFCCDMCPGEFKANTAKYATKANMQLVCTKQAVEKVCPFTGNELNTDTKIKVGDATVCFCCQMCQGKAMNTPAGKLINDVFNDKTFAKAFEIKKK